MTASRYKLPASFAEMAGRKFGINLLDLFKDDEEGQSETSGFLPQFSTKVIEKGRGGALSYKALRTPTRESTFQLAPELPGQGGSSVTIGDITATGGTTTKEEVKEPEKPAVQISSQWGQDPAYFGHEDYFRNLEQGATPTQIQEFLDKNINLLRGSNVPGGGGLYDQIKAGNVPTLGSSGQAVVQQQQQAQSNQPQQQPSYSISAGQSADYLGHADVEAAKAQGASNQDIARWVATNIDKLRGSNVPGGGGLYDEYKQYL